MEFNIQFTYDQVIDIISQMPELEREKLKKEVIQKEDLSKIESLIMEDFKKYETTFKSLA